MFASLYMLHASDQAVSIRDSRRGSLPLHPGNIQNRHETFHNYKKQRQKQPESAECVVDLEDEHGFFRIRNAAFTWPNEVSEIEQPCWKCPKF